MKFAYADPPYIGYSRYYKADPNAAEVDHEALLAQLCNDYDAWALSCYTNSLGQILRMPTCPQNVRIGAWVKPWSPWHKGINPTYQWEPVIFWNCRARGLDETAARDWISANAPMMTGLMGSKPLRFCFWIFEMIGASPADTLVDLFPGTGIVTRAWEAYCHRPTIANLPLFAEASTP